MLDARRNILGCSECVFKKPQRHAHIVSADVHRRMSIDERIQRQIFIELIDIAAQFQVVLIPVKDDATDTWVMLDNLKQIGTVMRPDKLESARL
ncbi:hypothetical protein D3C87_2003840 [compost metagenome]